MRVWFSPDGNVRTSKTTDSSGSGHKNLIYSISHSPNGNLFASTSEDKTIKIWGIDGTLITTIQNNNPILEVQFSPDNKMLASAGKDQTVRLWNLEGNLLKIFRGHNAQVNSVAFSPNGTLLASGSLDKSVKLWTLDGTLLETFPSKNEVNQVGFSHDGKILVTATNDEVTLWNFDLDDLVIKSCNYIGNYLITNNSLNQEDKHLCDHVNKS
jgi:WD40 repeat protein